MSQQEALRQLYLDCRDDLESLLASRLQCRETAADISHEAFLRLHRSEHLHSVGNLRAYLFRVALNLANDHFRAATVRGTPPEDAEAVVEKIQDRRGAETVVSAAQQLEVVIAALAELPELTQRIFYLNRFDGLKHREIADRLGVSIRTVEDHLRKALLHCHRRVGVGAP